MDFDFIDCSDEELKKKSVEEISKLVELLARARLRLDEVDQRFMLFSIDNELFMEKVLAKVIYLPDEVFHKLPLCLQKLNEDLE